MHRRSLAAGLAALIGIGALTASKVGATETTSYSYDALGQLTGINYKDGVTATYSYDGAGNPTSVVKSTSAISVGLVTMSSEYCGYWGDPDYSVTPTGYIFGTPWWDWGYGMSFDPPPAWECVDGQTDYEASPWIKFDLGVSYPIDKVTLTQVNGDASTATVQYSTNGTTWTTLGTPASGASVTYNMSSGTRSSATSARYFRVTDTWDYLTVPSFAVQGWW